MSDFKIGVASVTFREKTIEEIVEICKREQVEYIEWGADVHVKTLDDAKKATEKAVEEQPTSISDLPYNIGINLPVAAQNKVLYFQNLLASKVITPEQYERYTQKVLATELAPAEEK